MPAYRSNAGHKALRLLLATSLLLSTTPAAFADPGDVNSTNNGRDIVGGTYYNTPTGKTTFINTGKTGLYLKAGDLVTGREVHPDTLAETGNGGHLHFNAPGQVVRLDGNVDVSAILQNGKYNGDGGRVTIEAGALYQNGQILAGGRNGGVIKMDVTSMTMGPGALIQAKGFEGAGGVVNINARGAVNIPVGAVVDTSGAVIGTYNTNVINVKGGLVNLDGILMANGLNPGQQGGKVAVYATDSIQIGPNGKILANGADGQTGNNPTNGGNGGFVEVSAEKHINNDGLIAANGGKGGTNPETASGEVANAYDEHGRQIFINQQGNQILKMKDQNGNTIYINDKGQSVSSKDLVASKVQFSEGQDGGRGGNGGDIDIRFKGQMTNDGAIEVKGGDGGNGQIAISDEVIYGPHHHIAYGGTGGDGGTGGKVRFFGNPSQDVLDNVNVSGGSGGQGGAASTLNDCGCAIAGAGGACGAPGSIEIFPYKPPTTPNTPLFPPYPREYPRLGDALPPNTSQVLNYNRSIFLARAPLPIIQKKAPPPAPVAPPPAPAPVKPTPKPVQKKVPVRGFW